MSKVFVPQQIAPRLAAHGGAIATIKTASSTAATTRLSLHAKNNRMSSKPSDSINSKTEQNPKRVPPFRYNTNGYNTNGKPDTTPLSSPKQHNHRGNNHQRHHSDSTITNSVPQSPNQLDFDDFNSSSSIMEFLRQERQCANGGIESPNDHDSEADAESIFQEVSRLADNSDTRSVDELLREAEILLQHQEFMDNVNEENRKSPRFHCATQTTSIRMNSKYTKRIENVNPRSTLNKIVNGYGSEISMLDECTPPLMTPETPTVTSSLSDVGAANSNTTFNNFVNNMVTASVISMESAPPNFPDDSTATITQCSSNEDNTTGKDVTTKQIDDEDTDDSADTIEEIAEAIESIEICIPNDEHGQDDDEFENQKEFVGFSQPLNDSNEDIAAASNNNSSNLTNSTLKFHFNSMASTTSTRTRAASKAQQQNLLNELTHGSRRPSCDNSDNAANQSVHSLASPLRLAATTERCSSGSYPGRRSSMTTPDSGVSSQSYLTGSATMGALLSQRSSSPNVKSIGIGTTSRTYCDKSVNSSPVRMVSVSTSPICEQPSQVDSTSSPSIVSLSREHILKQEIEQLQERLKDTEERLESFRLQHDTVSQLHRSLRESNTHLLEESEILKLDVQHLNECANVLRSELQAARNDRDEALDLQKVLHSELEVTRAEKKQACEQKEKDAKHIQDLQRQCREMERILMRKHPDSVSALIVASKSSCISGKDSDNANSRKLLEQRIAQLESDAKEQDYKAQQILANVQARFNSVQSKYETHIADLETQVLSLQEINTKLNEKIESQVRTLDYFVSKKAEKFYNNCTQTDEIFPPHITQTAAPAVATPKTRKICRKTISTQTTLFTRESSTNTIGTFSQHSASSSTSSTANSTPNNSRPNSKQSGIRKPTVNVSGSHLSSALVSKLPVSQSDSTISLSASQLALTAKEDAQLVATIRGMRVDLAIKNKALQRLTRELDECKKTIKKIQRDKEAFKYQSITAPAASCSTAARLNMDYMPATTESQILKDAQSKCKLLESDYKSLCDKRIKDLKTLQTAHERELATCHETVRILQQRLNERDEQFAMQKRRKLPVDYYALKAKVSSLERRHTEREERLHMLVDALSKGRLNGALDDLLGDNNNQ